MELLPRPPAIASPPKPDLAFRVGVTGSRTLDPAEVPRLERQLRQALKAVRETLARLATETDVGHIYSRDREGKVTPRLRFLSPLARGADQLAARVAIESDLGFSLHVPMPFAKADYERDFVDPGELSAFQQLLAQARESWLALDGPPTPVPAATSKSESPDGAALDPHGPAGFRAYEAVGRYVVRHSDLLIAIWDGQPGNGRGGTADIVRYAGHFGVSTLCLNPIADQPPVWLADIQDIRDSPSSITDPIAAICQHIERLVRPPPPSHRHTHSWLTRIARCFRSFPATPYREYLTERLDRRSFFWNSYGWLMRRLADYPERGEESPA